MRNYEKKEVTIIKEIETEIICDTCKKVINTKDRSAHYYKVRTSHARWGNDSHESAEYWDFCSYECLIEHMNKFFENGANTDNYDIERIG
ncbi:hypothetical protein [Bacillus swezeyi]|uniref:Uncharacterized protein n=1 Tax=Bacillus swezeyi TaxID=1925020 RepID=A0A5M8RT32_9BACI|nr:hypothetical protein [Bacillus swezeyi]KAA6450971.1 hypothetical protein DX927_09065 [Bacillus swezeyi]